MQTPAQNRTVERRELFVVKTELVRWEAVGALQHLRQHPSVEPGVLLGRELKEMIEAVHRFQRGEVDEVAGLDPTEEGEQLVGGQLLEREGRSDGARLGR